MEAFDLAEQFQTPVFVMMDLDLGMNNWMSDAFKYPDQADQPRQAADAAKLEEARRVGPLQGRRRRRHRRTARSRATACRRTSRAAPATTPRASTASGPDDYVDNMDRLARKFETARTATCRSRWSSGAEAPRSGSSPTARRTGRSRRAAISCARRPTSRRRTSGCAAYPFTDGAGDVHRRARARSTSSSRTATRSCCS